MATKTIHAYTAATTIDGAADFLLIDPASSGTYNKISRNVLLGITSTPIGAADGQTLSNKVLDNSNTITVKDGTNLTLQNASDTTKQVRFSLSGITTGNTRTLTLPNRTDTLVTLAGTETLTNKTITSPVITGGTIDNSTITVDSISGHTSATQVTVGGVLMNNGVISTGSAVTAVSIAAGGVQPQALVAGTGTGWAWSTWASAPTNITQGNGTITSNFIQIGKTIFFYWRFTMGTTSAMGTTPTFTLPATANSKYLASDKIGSGSLKSGSTDGPCYVNFLTTTTASVVVQGAASTYEGPQANITSSVPGTWSGAAADYINVTGFYEAA